jgi:carbon-monoxide dehydrogenase large subunit
MRIGESQVRIEDDRFLKGQGQYTDDIRDPAAARLAILRSPVAAGRIVTLDVAEARSMPGVLEVLTRDELAADNIGNVEPVITHPAPDGGPMTVPDFRPLAMERVVHVGEPVVAVIAETIAQAEAAIETIILEIEETAAVTDCLAASAPDAPKVWPDRKDNRIFLYEAGDKAATDAAFDGAAHVVSQRFRISRVAPAAMEPRAAIGSYDPETGEYKLVHGGQSAHRQLASMSKVLCIEPEKLHLVVAHTGGGFGMKNAPFAEYMLCLIAARRIGRPVRWTASRLESFMGDSAARDQVADAELALDAAGNFLGVRVKAVASIGANVGPMSAHPPTMNIGGLAGVYRTPHIHAEITGMFTNTMYTAPYRGAGRPEATFIIERLVDMAARRLGRDRSELRLQNMIKPEQMPYDTGFIFTYDSGDFPSVMARAKTLADWDGFPARKAVSAARGKRRGIGISCPIEIAGGPLGKPAPEFARIELSPEGRATLFLGSVDSGQGHQTSFRQVLCQRLGLAPDEVEIVVGDNKRVANGIGSFGSRSMAAGGTAISVTVRDVGEQLAATAGEILETHEADIEFLDGEFRVRGTDRSIALKEVLKKANRQVSAETFSSADNATFPNGCHICEVEVDPETGSHEMLNYVVVDDVGTVINPLLLKGQIHGGVAQGAGQSLVEAMVFDEAGQMLTASFMDYGMPRADNFSNIEVEAFPVPTKVNPLGVKGAGEAGTVGGLAAALSAICDAVDVDHMEMPATPERVWRALNGG